MLTWHKAPRNNHILTSHLTWMHRPQVIYSFSEHVRVNCDSQNQLQKRSDFCLAHSSFHARFKRIDR